MGVYFVLASTCLQVSHQYIFENELIQLSGETSCLFTASLLQVIERVHIFYEVKMACISFKFIIYPSFERVLQKGMIKSKIFRKLSLNFSFSHGS